MAVAEAEMDLDFPFADLRIDIMRTCKSPRSSSDVSRKSRADWGRRRKERGDDRKGIAFSSTTLGTSVLQVINIPVNSAALAATSPFFSKLFSNCKKEYDKRHAILTIADSEQNAFVELLGFVCSGKLTATEPTLLLDILEAAEEFGVVSCMKECSRMLANLPMKPESALFYLDYSCSNSMPAALQPLTDAAKKFLCNEYSDFTKFEAEAANIPLAGIEAILSSNDLEVESEDEIFDFVLRWAHSQYPKLEERREILNSHLLPLVRFNHMTWGKLLDILACICTCIDHEQVNNFIVEAIMYKDDRLYQLSGLAADARGKFAERAYIHRPLDVVRPNLQRAHCVAFFYLRREDCARLFKSGYVRSEPLQVGCACFFLQARYDRKQECIGLFWVVQEMSSASMTVSYEFGARVRFTDIKEMSLLLFKDNYKYTSPMVPKAVGCHDLFQVPWSFLTAANSPFLIDGMLQLKFELRVVNQQDQ